MKNLIQEKIDNYTSMLNTMKENRANESDSITDAENRSYDEQIVLVAGFIRTLKELIQEKEFVTENTPRIKFTESEKEAIRILNKYPNEIVMLDGFITGGHGISIKRRIISSLEKKGVMRGGKLIKTCLV